LSSQSSIETYLFTNIQSDHTISVTFAPILKPTASPSPWRSLPLDVIAAVIAIVAIVMVVGFQLSRVRGQASVRTRFFPSIDDPKADMAVAKDIGGMKEKLEVFKKKYPERSGIKPAPSTDELFDRTRIRTK
jgi:hypothetical protein